MDLQTSNQTIRKRRASNSSSNSTGHENSMTNDNAFTADLFKPTASCFNLKRRRGGSIYIPPSAERTKRFYPELQADQDFLHQMLDIWNAKLEQLQMDEKILVKMSRYPKSKVQGVKPLLERSNCNEQLFESSREDTLQQQQHESTSEEDDDEEEYVLAPEGDTSAASALQQEQKQESEQYHWTSGLVESEDDDDEEEEEGGGGQMDAEDEEETRRALTFMLAEFGDALE